MSSPSDLTCQALGSLNASSLARQGAADHQWRQLQAAGWTAWALPARGAPWLEVAAALPMPSVWTAEWDVSPHDCFVRRRMLPVVRWARRHVLLDACLAPSFATIWAFRNSLVPWSAADGVFDDAVLSAAPRSLPSMIHWLHFNMGIPYRRIYKWSLRLIKARYREHAQTYRAWVTWDTLVAIDPDNKHLHYRGDFPLAVEALHRYMQGDPEALERHREH